MSPRSGDELDDTARRFRVSRERAARRAEGERLRRQRRESSSQPPSTSYAHTLRGFFGFPPPVESHGDDERAGLLGNDRQTTGDGAQGRGDERRRRTSVGEGGTGVGDEAGGSESEDPPFERQRIGSRAFQKSAREKLTSDSLRRLDAMERGGYERTKEERAERAVPLVEVVLQRSIALPKAWRAWAATASVSMACSCTGLAIGFPFAARRTMLCESAAACADGATREEMGNLQSSLFIGAVFGALLAGRVSDKLGRRVAVIFATLPAIVGWTIVYYTPAASIAAIVGKALAGTSVGALSTAAPLLLGEGAVKQDRGAHAILPTTAVAKGILVMYTASLMPESLHWRHFAALAAGANALAFAATFIATVESPRWYLTREMPLHAIEALTTLRGAWEERQTIEEATTIISRENAKTSPPGSYAELRWWHILTVANLIRCTTMVTTLIGVQQLGGLSLAVHDDPQIPSDAAVPSSKETRIAYVITLMLGIMLCARMIDLVGRKPCMLVSLVGMFASNVSIATFASVSVHGSARDALDVSVVCFAFFFGLGMSGIPTLISVELFPQHARATATAIVCALYWLYTFGMTFGYELSLEAFGSANVHGFFATVCLLGVVYVRFFVPETSNLALEEAVALLTPARDATVAERPVRARRSGPTTAKRSVIFA